MCRAGETPHSVGRCPQDRGDGLRKRCSRRAFSPRRMGHRKVTDEVVPSDTKRQSDSSKVLNSLVFRKVS